MKNLGRIANVFREMDGEFLDGSKESLARALKTTKVFYLVVVCVFGVCATVIIVLGILRHS